MTPTPANAVSVDAPNPPRFWWFKRIGIALIITVAGVALLNSWWIRAADREYRAVIDSAHARGEPILPEDFDSASVLDEQNKAVFLRNAATAINQTKEYSTFEQDYDSDAPLTPELIALLKQFVPANSRALDLARKARSAPGVDWRTPMRTPVLNSTTAFQHLNLQREVATLLGRSALYNHSIGNDREAVETILDMLNVTDAVGRGPATLVVNLVCIGLTAMTTDTVEKIAPDLKVDPPNAPPGAKASTSASREQLTRLISLLADEGYWQQQIIRGWQGERMEELDAYNMFSSMGQNGVSRSGTPLFRAGLELDIVRASKRPAAGIIATTRPNYSAAMAAMPREDPNPSRLEEASTILSRILTPAIGRAIEQQYRVMLDRRVAAIRIAFRLYRIDHHGKYPDTLSALVPDYLPFQLTDPFAADNRPLAYRPDPKLPVVYSVGANGKDDGGTSLPYRLPNGSQVPRWECADIVYPLELIYPLAPTSPATQPSPEAEDHK